MKNDGFALFIVLAFVVILTSCASPGGGGNTGNPPPPAPAKEKGTLKLEADADAVGASQAWIEMEDESGNLVFSDSINIVDKSFSITLPVGNYTILKYILVDSSGKKLSVVPIKGKKAARFIPDDSCLPFEIEVTKGTSTPMSPQAVPYNDTPGDFGFSEDDLKKPVPPTTGGGTSSGSSSDRFKVSPFAPTILDITITSETIYESGNVVITLATNSVKKPVSQGMIKVYSPDYLSGDTSGVVLEPSLQPKPDAGVGVWEAVIPVGKYHEKGEWVIASLMVADKNGKASFYEYKDTSTTHLVNRASKKASSLAIPKFKVSGNRGDTTPPNLTGALSGQTAVSIPGSVTFSVSFADGVRGSGVMHGSIVVSNSDPTVGSIGLPLQYNSDIDSWYATVNFEEGFSSGKWVLAEINVRDNIGNNTTYEYDKTKSTEYYYNKHTNTVITDVKIASVNVLGDSSDGKGPIVNSLNTSTTSINTSGKVVISLDIADTGVGLQGGQVMLLIPLVFPPNSTSHKTKSLTLNFKTLKWEAEFDFVDADLAGDWDVFEVFVEDKHGNSRTYMQDEAKNPAFNKLYSNDGKILNVPKIKKK